MKRLTLFLAILVLLLPCSGQTFTGAIKAVVGTPAACSTNTITITGQPTTPLTVGGSNGSTGTATSTYGTPVATSDATGVFTVSGSATTPVSAGTGHVLWNVAAGGGYCAAGQQQSNTVTVNSGVPTYYYSDSNNFNTYGANTSSVAGGASVTINQTGSAVSVGIWMLGNTSATTCKVTLYNSSNAEYETHSISPSSGWIDVNLSSSLTITSNPTTLYVTSECDGNWNWKASSTPSTGKWKFLNFSSYPDSSNPSGWSNDGAVTNAVRIGVR